MYTCIHYSRDTVFPKVDILITDVLPCFNKIRRKISQILSRKKQSTLLHKLIKQFQINYRSTFLMYFLILDINYGINIFIELSEKQRFSNKIPHYVAEVNLTTHRSASNETEVPNCLGTIFLSKTCEQVFIYVLS